MNWKDYPFYRLLIPLIFGIFLGYYVAFRFSLLFGLFINIILFIVLYYSLFRFSIRRIILQGVIIQFIFIVFGYFLSQQNFPYKKPEYFGNYIHEASAFIVCIDDLPKVSEKTIGIRVRNNIAVINDTEYQVEGLSNFVLLRDSITEKLKYNDVLLVQNYCKEIDFSGNPYQFDYKKYCYDRGIKYQQFISSKHFTILKHSEHNKFMEYVLNVKIYLINVLDKYIETEDSKAVASALILGYKNDLSDELQKAYSGAGAIHVLAVSGLHVGIIYMILEHILLLFPFFKRKKSRMAVFLILFIWMFAILTGLPPSVRRAAMMFSFVIIGKSLDRPTSIFNSIGVSAFMLLVFNPYLIFDVGFQLSYTAVLSIVTIQPFIQKLWNPHFKVIKYFWSILSVTIAAQIGTLPITLFYFKQFPVLFIFSNFVVIPASFVAMLLGLTLFAFSFLPVVAVYIGKMMDFILWIMNGAIVSIESFSFSVIREIPFNIYQFVFLSLMVITLFTFLILKMKRSIFLFFGFSLLFSISILIQKIDNDRKHEFIVFSTKNQSLLCIHDSQETSYFADSSVFKSFDKVKFQIQNHRIMNQIKDFRLISLNDSVVNGTNNFEKISEFFIWNTKILVVNPTYVRPDCSFIKVDYLIVFNNSKSPPEYSCTTYSPEKVILASNLSVYKRDLWTKYLQKSKISCYDISKKGAFVIDSYY